MEWGVNVFDSSAGGIGGCPYAPGAKGNVATEALVSYFDQIGVDTDIDLKKLNQAFQPILEFIEQLS